MWLDVDGPRPAVAWVTSLPRTWLLQGDRHVLLVMALDTFDQHEPYTCRPGTSKLWTWTGDKSKGTLINRLDRLAQPTEIRPALIEVMEEGRGTRGTLYRLCTEVRPEASGLADRTASGLADRTASSGLADRTATDGQRSDLRSDLRSGRSDHPFPTHLPTTPRTSHGDRARGSCGHPLTVDGDCIAGCNQ